MFTRVRTTPLVRVPPLRIECPVPATVTPNLNYRWQATVAGQQGEVTWSITSDIEGISVDTKTGLVILQTPYFSYGAFTLTVTDTVGAVGTREFALISSLFQYNCDGRHMYLYDLNAPGTVFQDEDCTIPALIGNPVRGILPVTMEHEYRLVRRDQGPYIRDEAVLRRDAGGLAFIKLSLRRGGAVFGLKDTQFPHEAFGPQRTYSVAMAFRSLSKVRSVPTHTPFLTASNTAAESDTGAFKGISKRGCIAFGISPGRYQLDVSVYAPSVRFDVTSQSMQYYLTDELGPNRNPSNFQRGASLPLSTLPSESNRPQVIAGHYKDNSDHLDIDAVHGFDGRLQTDPQTTPSTYAYSTPAFAAPGYIDGPCGMTSELSVGNCQADTEVELAFYRVAAVTGPIERVPDATQVFTVCTTGLVTAAMSPASKRQLMEAAGGGTEFSVTGKSNAALPNVYRFDRSDRVYLRGVDPRFVSGASTQQPLAPIVSPNGQLGPVTHQVGQVATLRGVSLFHWRRLYNLSVTDLSKPAEVTSAIALKLHTVTNLGSVSHTVVAKDTWIHQE